VSLGLPSLLRILRRMMLIHKTGAHRAQRFVAYGFPVEAWITRRWRIVKEQSDVSVSPKPPFEPTLGSEPGFQEPTGIFFL